MRFLDSVSSHHNFAPGTSGIDCLTLLQCSLSIVPRLRWIARHSFFVIFFVCATFASQQQTARTLQTFGITVKHGQPVYPPPSNVALGLFNPDPLLDLAYFNDGKVQVWQNLGNGTFGIEPLYELSARGEILKMEWKKETTWSEDIPDQFSWGELHITYSLGAAEIVTHELMTRAATFLSSPLRMPMVPPIDFREKWRSATQTEPTRFMSVGDIDSDGRIEVVYAFYRYSNDSTHLVVYECVRADSFVVDWDTVMIRSFGPYATSDADRNGQKEIVLTYHPGGGAFTSRVVLLECSGGGNEYKAQQIVLAQINGPYDPPVSTNKLDLVGIDGASVRIWRNDNNNDLPPFAISARGEKFHFWNSNQANILNHNQFTISSATNELTPDTNPYLLLRRCAQSEHDWRVHGVLPGLDGRY